MVPRENVEIRVGPATDPERYRATDQLVWFEEPRDAPVQEQVAGVPERLRFAAEVPGSDLETYPGIYGVRPMTLSIPGPGSAAGTGVRQVPCAGLTWVGVHPDHRRTGILTAMLRHHFEQVREEGEAHVSALHASEPAIYGRHGYGLASLELAVHLGRGTTLVAPHLDEQAAKIRTRMSAASEKGMPERIRACQLAAGAQALGAMVGAPDYYEMVCRRIPEHERDKEPMRVLFAQRDRADVGMAMFRREHKWERGRPSGKLEVLVVVGDPPARLALLRRLVDFDLMGTVKLWGIGVEDPLHQWTAGPREATDIEVADSLWVRLVDLPAALTGRSYAAPCDVVVEVSDTAAPWNEGSWRIVVDDAGSASVERTSADADLKLPVQALGAAYLGGTNLLGQVRAGVVLEARPGAALGLWRALRADVAPGTAIGF
ncbi:MAG: GNAT family N-acetyltransferase [Marmoricola sp.]